MNSGAAVLQNITAVAAHILIVLLRIISLFIENGDFSQLEK